MAGGWRAPKRSDGADASHRTGTCLQQTHACLVAEPWTQLTYIPPLCLRRWTRNVYLPGCILHDHATPHNTRSTLKPHNSVVTAGLCTLGRAAPHCPAMQGPAALSGGAAHCSQDVIPHMAAGYRPGVRRGRGGPWRALAGAAQLGAAGAGAGCGGGRAPAPRGDREVCALGWTR